VGFGSEVLFLAVLGLLLVGPKRLPAVLRHVARAKAQLENATRVLKSELEAGIASQNHDGKTDPLQQSAGGQ
jgi:Sec-independent protein translocase protein TatA